MDTTASDITRLVDGELSQMEPALAARIRQFLVAPYCVTRESSYRAETYACWTFLEHQPSGTGIAYCRTDLWPNCPWGLVWLSGDESAMQIGMDCNWYSSLEEAFLESWAAE
jgi:hypothetical protein